MRPFVSSLIALTLLGVACTDRGTTVVMTVGSATTISPARLHLEATAAGRTRSFDLTPPRATIPPEVTIALEIPKSIGGRLDLVLTALDASDHELGRATAMIDLAVGTTVPLQLTFGGGSGDGGADLRSSDGGGADAALDQSVMLDGAEAADLTPTVEVDLLLGPDLSPLPFSMIPASHDYLAQNAGTATAPFTFKMQNTGPDSAVVQAAMITGPQSGDFVVDSDGCKDFTYATNATPCDVTVSFHPTESGIRTATLIIADAAGRQGTATLVGQAVGVLGKPCSGTTDCQSGKCTDGVCCDLDAAACSGCKACNVAALEGTCSPVPDGQDPKSACTGKACTNSCDGAGACKPFVADTLCAPASTTCVNATPSYGQFTTAGFTDQVCNGSALDCTGTKARPCAAGAICNGNACRATCGTDFDCVRGFFCDTAGDSTCKAALPPDSTCNRVRQCAYGVCEGGKCQRGCFQSAVIAPTWASSVELWNMQYPWPCVPGTNGVNAYSGGCSGGGGPACTASALGSVCDGNGSCACTADVECTNQAAPHCVTGQTYPANGTRCTCYTWDSAGKTPMKCGYGQKCVVPKGTTFTDTGHQFDSCKTLAGFPCNAAAECVSGVCTNGNCQ